MRESSYSEQDAEPEFWFNTKTNAVEVGLRSAASYRIGPFASRAEAEQALDIVAERARQIRESELESDDWND